MAPPTITEVYEVPSWTATTSPRSSSALTVAPGDVLMVLASGSASNAPLTLSDNSGGAVSWTATSRTTSSYTPIYLWTATIPAGVTSITITISRASGSSYYGFNVLKAAPCGGLGTPVSGAGTSGGPSLAITTTQADSAIVYISSDYNSASVSGRTWRQVNSSNPVEDYVATPSSSIYVAHYADAGAAGSKTTGLSAPTGQKWQAIAVEVQGAVYVDADVTTSWDVGGYVESDVSTSWDVYTAVAADVTTAWTVFGFVDAEAATSWRIDAFIDADVTTSWAVRTLGNWRDIVASPRGQAALTAQHRDVSCRVILVDQDHRPVTAHDHHGDTLRDVPIIAGEVSMTGESDQVWSCQLSIADPRWIPRTPADPLHPLSPYRVAIFWRLELAAGLYLEVPLGVYRTGRPRIGSAGVTVDGLDVVSVAKRGGYGGKVVPVGGMTVDAALTRLFGIVAPTVPFRAAASTVTLPEVYELGRRKPSEDWVEIAALAGQVVRADREGFLTAQTPSAPETVAMRLVEGPGCPMSDVERELGDVVYNRVVVNGTNPDLAEPVSAVDEDTDETSPTYVGRFGPYELAIDSDAVDSVEAAKNLARMTRGRYRRPSEKVTATIKPRPDRDPGDLVEVVRRRVGLDGGLQRVASWRMPLPVGVKGPGLMSVEFMPRQVD